MKELSKSFNMKDLGPVPHILSIHIYQDRKAQKLWSSPEKYVEQVCQRFNMENVKPMSLPLANHFKLSKKSCPSS